MAEFTLKAAPVLGGLEQTFGDNRVGERTDLALVSVATPVGGDGKLEKALRSAFSLALPQPVLSTTKGDMRAVWMAPEQIMLIFPHSTPDAESHVQMQLKGAGYTTDQTDGWAVLEVSGPQTLSALERICPVDLALEAFPENASARIVMEHLGAVIVRLEVDRFLLASASSSAGSFAHAVETSFRYVT